MKFYGLIGRHLSHSWSRLIHTQFGCDEYSHVELEPDEIKGFFDTHEIGGLNVTIPYKKDVIPYLDVISKDAEAIGCVNTVITDNNGRLVGHNTDAAGFLFMARSAGIYLRDKKALIFGSGGASLAVRYALILAGARDIRTISRSGEDNYDNLSRHEDAEILINATPVGMYPEPNARIVDLARFPKCQGVLDLIYNPYKTHLLIQAEELGIPCANGLTMLVAQAKAAEEYFKRKKIADSEIMEIVKIISRDERNIVLIGMPGSGKSSAGAALSALSGKEIIDIDAEIVKATGITIPEIFAKGGEALFRKIESEEIEKVCNSFGKIIVTGGGAVTVDKNYLPLKRCGRIYHLERDTSLLPREGRPLSQGSDLEIMYKNRLPFYQKFRDTVIEVSPDVTVTAERIWSDFCENSCY